MIDYCQQTLDKIMTILHVEKHPKELKTSASLSKTCDFGENADLLKIPPLYLKLAHAVCTLRWYSHFLHTISAVAKRQTPSS